VSLTHFNFETFSSSVDSSGIQSVKRVSVIAPVVKRITILLASILSLAFGGIGLYFAALQLGDNFHAVVPGQLYRSAQPTAALIAEYQEKYSIKTIINLRGDNTGSDWYDAEVDEAKKLGIAHVDFRMSARRMMTTEQFNQIIDVLQKAEKPVLIHCNSGSDRSGLVAALYVAAIAKLGEEAAESQISFRYGHIPLSITSAYAMDRSFETFEAVLGFPHS
jgi:protein tyrosine/serine phosphatase